MAGSLQVYFMLAGQLVSRSTGDLPTTVSAGLGLAPLGTSPLGQ